MGELVKIYLRPVLLQLKTGSLFSNIVDVRVSGLGGHHSQMRTKVHIFIVFSR